MTICKGLEVRQAVAVGAYKAVELGLFGAEMAGGCFFLGLLSAALVKCEGFAGQRKYCERHSGEHCWQTACWMTDCCLCERLCTEQGGEFWMIRC